MHSRIARVRSSCKLLVAIASLVVAASALALLGPVARVQAASCGTVVASDGFRAAAITTKRLSCSRGRAVLRHWLADHGRPVDGPSGWNCSYKSRVRGG